MKKICIKNGNLIQSIAITAPSRVSLVGNPSDLAECIGIGAVLSMPVWGLNASVSIQSSDVSYIDAPRSKHATLADMLSAIKQRGAGDWELIADTTLKVFGDMLESVDKEILNVPVAIHMDTNIPRQRGMSGSSGMIVAFLRALLIMHQLENSSKFKPRNLAKWALEVENILGVHAGLQDRVLQAVSVADSTITALFMDFSRMVSGNGPKMRETYKQLRNNKLFKAALILSSQPSHSGEVHKPIVAKIKARNKQIIDYFTQLDFLAREAQKAFQHGDWPCLGELMNQNANIRVEIYGQKVLGALNMALIDACEKAGCPRNFTGSGGAVVAMLPDGDKSFRRLQQEVENRPEGKFEIYHIN